MATIWTDEALGLAVVWHGGATFNVCEISEEGGFGRVYIGAEVDVFTSYNEEGNAPALAQAAESELDYPARSFREREACGECGALHGEDCHPASPAYVSAQS